MRPYLLPDMSLFGTMLVLHGIAENRNDGRRLGY